MDFIDNCFEEYRSSFTRKLEGVEISGDTANVFLSETAARLMYIIKTAPLEKTIQIMLSDDPSRLLKLIDVNAMAIKMDLRAAQVNTGLRSIAPVVSRVFSLKSNEIIAATASLAWKTSDEHMTTAGSC